MGGRARFASLAAVAMVMAMLAAAPSASADYSSTLLTPGTCTLHDAADGSTSNGPDLLPYRFCDDGVPVFGGTTANPLGASAVQVPAAYAGAAGLPAKDSLAAATVPGADPSGDVSLDVDVTLPTASMPTGGYPVVVMMHGCCSGNKTSWESQTIDGGGAENWHYNNAWYASRGYVVVNYTARGFVDASGHGSTGQTQLDSNKFEINDYQSLVAQLADVGDIDPVTSGVQKIDPAKIVPTGGSYGGGFAWLALTDPTWAEGGHSFEVVAAAAKYGWTNLLDSLVPNGAYLRDRLPPTNPATAGTPVGFPKRTINLALYGSGKTGIPPGTAHTTFAPDIDQAQACLTSSDPFESNPLCATTFATTLPRFINERSAYYQSSFFAGLGAGAIAPVPIFSAGTFTDQLFPAAEHRRMVERLKATKPGYPVQEYYGDYNHFVQDKRKEFADLCGADRHVCAYSDYPGGNLNADPPSLSARGVTSRLDRFIDHYAAPPANPTQPTPAFDVTGSLQVCPQNAAALGAKPDEPGPRFTASTFGQLAPNRLTVGVSGAQATTSTAAPNVHAKNEDPVGNLAKNGGACPVESSPGQLASAGPGVGTYDSSVLPRDYTMLGLTRVIVPHTGAGAGLQLNARLYDLYPDGTQVLADRGVKRLASANETTTFDLHGAGFRFARGHRLRIELAQDDDPYIKASVQPGALNLSGVTLSVPIREASASIGGRVGPSGTAGIRTPRLASDQGTSARFRMRIRRRPGTPPNAVDHYQVVGRDTRKRSSRLLASNLHRSFLRFRGRRGRTYRFRVRTIGPNGEVGPW